MFLPLSKQEQLPDLVFGREARAAAPRWDWMEWNGLVSSPLIGRQGKGAAERGREMKEGGGRRSAALSANPIQSWVGMDAHGVILILLPSVLLMPWHHLESVE